MLKLILAAVLALHSHPRSESYAKIIHEATVHWGVHPALVLAVIDHETGGTWRVRAKSHTNDYGLMQLHVSRTTNKRYIGRERLLYRPRLNIRIGVRMLRFWRGYHERRCKNPKHHWISHYNQGGRVRSLRYERRVLAIHRKLMARYWRKSSTLVAIYSWAGLL